jgi:hypothetical protein
LWGIVEATIGYALHFLPTLTAGVVMFAFASFLMMRAWGKTNSRTALFAIGLIAAAIKAVDFALPPHPIYGYVKVINPMFCIVLESLVLAVLVPVLADRKPAVGIMTLAGASVLWRLVFLGYLVGQDAVFGTVSTQIQSVDAALTFVVVNGAASAGIAILFYGIHLLLGKRPGWKWLSHPALAMGLLTLAVFLTLQF